LVCGDQHGAPFVSGADQFEQHAGLGLILGDVGDVVEDRCVKFIEFGDSAFEREIASGLWGLIPESAGSYVSENKYLISLYIFRYLFSGLAGKTVPRK
jgi:hypothetical protein